jgi:hypothetical protein
MRTVPDTELQASAEGYRGYENRHVVADVANFAMMTADNLRKQI